MMATKTWAMRMKRRHMLRFLAKIAVQTQIMKTLEYLTAAITLTKRDCNKMMSNIASATLPKIGIHRNVN